MGVLGNNLNTTIRFCLIVFNLVGFLSPREGRSYGIFFWMYWFFWFMFLDGGIIIAQTGLIVLIWGDLTLMTSAAFLLFTNLAFATKIVNIVLRGREIQDVIEKNDEELTGEHREEGIEMVKSCNRETLRGLIFYLFLCAVTSIGWISSAGTTQLIVRAWYPYDTSTSPAYELTYAYQISSLLIAATVNVCLDTLVTSLIATCRCRLRLLGLSLRNLFEGIQVKPHISASDEKIVYSRLQYCAIQHDAILRTAFQIQECFCYPILAQFTVSIVIICVTAYQLALEVENSNWIRVVSMVSYLVSMMLQVFLYCYQGQQLTDESLEIAGAAYECPWYTSSKRIRRALLIVMMRSRKPVKLVACGFTKLSFDCFTAIIKASYTFFTVLRQVEERN